MNTRRRGNKDLDPWRPAAVVQELVSHVMLVAFALYFGVGYLGLMLIFMAEIVIGNLISASLYPERGTGRHLLDLVKILGVMAFLLVFVIATYMAATDDGREGNPLARLHVEVDAVKSAVAFAAVHMSVLYLLARNSADPKLAWTRSVLMQNAATFIGLFFMIFVAAFAGPLVGGAAEMLGYTRSPVDAALIVCMAALRLSLALLLSRMPEREVRDISRTPYVD